MFEFIKKLLQEDAFGLHISDRQIKAIQLIKEGKEIKILSIAQKDIAAGIVKHGRVLKEQSLAKEILLLLEGAYPQAIKQKHCIVSISEQQIVEQIFFLNKDLKEKEVNEQLTELIEETIPAKEHQMKYNYVETENPDSKMIFVVGTKREVLAQYYDILKTMCELKPIVIEPDYISLMRNIDFDFIKNECTLFINLIEGKINYYTIWKGYIFDSNTIEVLEFTTNPIKFINDLKQSIDTFVDESNQNIKAILFSIESMEDIKIKERIERGIGKKITLVEKYRFNPIKKSAKGINTFKIATGLALRGIGASFETDINILDESKIKT